MTAPRSAVRHPIFARIYQRISTAAEKAGVAEHRARMLDGLCGRVVEIGAGNGLNFAHYPDTVTEVVAVEPEPYLRAKATAAAARASVRVTVMDGTADHIPVPDAAVDAGVASLVLCSVPDQAAALAELRRVIRPGGELRFYEHVAAEDHRWARRQLRADRVWSWFAGGCHLDRATADAIQQAGFQIDTCERFLFQPCLTAKLAAPHILGRATRARRAMTIDLGRARDLGARESGLAVVVTYRADGSVHPSVVNAGVLNHPVTGERVVGFVVRGYAKKLANLHRDPRAAVVFRSGWEWVAVEGTVTLVGPDDTLAGLPLSDVPRVLRTVYAAAVGGTADDWAQLDIEMAKERHTAAFIHPTRVHGNPVTD